MNDCYAISFTDKKGKMIRLVYLVVGEDYLSVSDIFNGDAKHRTWSQSLTAALTEGMNDARYHNHELIGAKFPD